ncbi:MAG: ABC transporter permease [Ruminiclostridium sp.]
MKALTFASRNIKEILRDPISWIFCVGFPIVMLALMSVINNSIPPEANMTVFSIESLSPGIMVFGFTFVMLFAALLVSGDRSEAFLLRVFTSPLKPVNYITGYILPLILLAVLQSLVNMTASLIMALVLGKSLDIPMMLLSIVAALPAIIMFVSFGILFGTAFNKNAAPGLCSVIICLSGMMGGIWMDVENIGGTIYDICNALPFYHCVKSARLILSGDIAGGFTESGIVLIWAVIVTLFAVILFKKKIRF